jgi:hypothetical protein
LVSQFSFDSECEETFSCDVVVAAGTFLAVEEAVVAAELVEEKAKRNQQYYPLTWFSRNYVVKMATAEFRSEKHSRRVLIFLRMNSISMYLVYGRTQKIT